MISLTELWLPILLSAVFVFIASSILHMVIPIHKNDFKKLPGEGKILETMLSQGIQPDTYMFPGADSMKELGTPEMIEKYKRGPVGFLTVVPSGPPGIGKNLVQWFFYTILIGVFVAYGTAVGLDRGANYLTVFRLAGTIAIAVHVIGGMPESIWKGQKWAITLKFSFDGLIYGLLTGGTFGWLWPALDSAV